MICHSQVSIWFEGWSIALIWCHVLCPISNCHHYRHWPQREAIQMLISAGVLCSTAVTLLAGCETCAFYASKPTASPISSRSNGVRNLEIRVPCFRILQAATWGCGQWARGEMGGESREGGMQKLKQGGAGKWRGLTSSNCFLSRNLFHPSWDGGALCGWDVFPCNGIESLLLGLGLSSIRCRFSWMNFLLIWLHLFSLYWDTGTTVTHFVNLSANTQLLALLVASVKLKRKKLLVWSEHRPSMKQGPPPPP